MKKIILILFGLQVFFIVSLMGKFSPVYAQTVTDKFGIHVMKIDELTQARDFFGDLGMENDQWQYVTLPLTLDDLSEADQWQQSFKKAKELKLIPIVRLTTKFEDGSWQVPSKKNIIEELAFLSALDWPTDQRYIIVFNEVNHAAEWGGRLDPKGYAEVLHFVADWAHTEKIPFIVLPAALDLSAPNSQETREAFNYWNQVNQADDQVISLLDAWNSHSYPNPAFSASPQKKGQQSMRGFESELAWLDQKDSRHLEVFITETGWQDNQATQKWLSNYYEYSFDHIWSDDRVRAVTPFILKGDPGPFSTFSFFNDQDQPTHQFLSLQEAIGRIKIRNELSFNLAY